MTSSSECVTCRYHVRVLCRQRIAKPSSRFGERQKGPLSGPGALLLLRVRRSAYGFFSTAVGPVANSWGDPLNPCAGATQSPLASPEGISCLEAGNEPTAPLAQHNAVAGRLWFRQEWTATPGSHNMPYVNPFVRGLRLPRWLRFSSTVGGQRPVTRFVEKAAPVARDFDCIPSPCSDGFVHLGTAAFAAPKLNRITFSSDYGLGRYSGPSWVRLILATSTLDSWLGDSLGPRRGRYPIPVVERMAMQLD